MRIKIYALIYLSHFFPIIPIAVPHLPQGDVEHSNSKQFCERKLLACRCESEMYAMLSTL